MKQIHTLIILFMAILPAAAGELVPPAAWQVKAGCRLKSSTDASFEQTGNKLTLETGEILVDVDADTIITTPKLFLKSTGKSLLLFKLSPDAERCFVIWDEGPSSVQVQTQQRMVKLGPASEIMVGDHQPRYSEIAANDNVGRRQIRIFELGKGFYMTKTEFSLVHIFDSTPLLHSLKTSDDPQDRAWKERILKTAAILGITTGKHGSYARRSW
jgi:hypothetical protein